MSVDILKLKTAAEAATSGQWVTDGEYVNEHGNVLYAYVAHENSGRIVEAFANCLVKTDEQCRANAHFIATANPPTVLALIAEIERHRQVDAEGCKPESITSPSSRPCAGDASGRYLNKAEGGTTDSNIHSGKTTTAKALSEAKAADNELMMAQVGLLAAVRRIYPTGSRLMIQACGNKIEVEVTGHCATWWSRPGYINGKNCKTDKPRTFHHSAVLEVLP